jgi:hypothetical protein
MHKHFFESRVVAVVDAHTLILLVVDVEYAAQALCKEDACDRDCGQHQWKTVVGVLVVMALNCKDAADQAQSDCKMEKCVFHLECKYLYQVESRKHEQGDERGHDRVTFSLVKRESCFDEKLEFDAHHQQANQTYDHLAVVANSVTVPKQQSLIKEVAQQLVRQVDKKPEHGSEHKNDRHENIVIRKKCLRPLHT